MNAEDKVRLVLSNEFGGQFVKRKLPVGKTISGDTAFKEFDAVSQDTKIVAMVKDYSASNKQGNQTRHARAIRDLYYLSLVCAERRVLYLSQGFYDWFKKRRDAAIAGGIEVRTIEA